MKGGAGVSSYNVPAKRRWKGLVILVLGLGLLSMLVHLVFLFGLPKGFHSYSGYAEDLSSDSDGLRRYSQHIDSETRDTSKDYQSRHEDDQITGLRTTLPKDIGGNSVEEANKTPLGQDIGRSSVKEANTTPLGQDLGRSSVEEANTTPRGQDIGRSSVKEANTTPIGQDPGSNSVEEAKNVTNAPPLPPDMSKLRSQANGTRSVDEGRVFENNRGNEGRVPENNRGSEGRVPENNRGSEGRVPENNRGNEGSVPETIRGHDGSVPETIRGHDGSVPENIRGNGDRITLCESKFGSYCLWQQEHRENMKDRTVKKMKDQLYVARAYYPSIAKLPALDKLSHELKQNIQEFERVLSEATTDKDLPPLIEKKIEKMEAVIIRTKSCNVDCSNVDKKFRQLVDLTEDEADFHMKQSAFLFLLAIQTIPKSLHCLSMRLTVEYFKSPPPDADESLTNKFSDPELYHYVIFSNNVLASSVVINSTVMNARETSTLVFHVLTDKQNYFAMKLWYFQNIYKEAVVQVLDIEDLKLVNQYNLSSFPHLLLPQEFRVSFRRVDKLGGKAWSQTEYLSVLSPAHYLLPDVFLTLKKVVILDDDVVVQRDLSALWSLNMGGKVNGALLLCTVRLFHLKSYLGKNSSSEESCAWMSGLNVIDLQRWRELDLTETYERFINEQLSRKQEFSEAVVLRATLLTYAGHVYGLDDSWMVSGLGNNYGLDRGRTEKAAALHYNGIMKPWLELGIPKYKRFWRKFLNPEIPFLNDCNVNP